MKKIAIQTKHQEIISHWSSLVNESDIAVDWHDADIRCWRCAMKKKNLNRCHIIPAALGGRDEPSNLILLCRECHKEAPDVLEPSFIWSWIKNTKAKSYDTWESEKASKSYSETFGESISQSLVSTLPNEIRSHQDFIRIAALVYRISLVPAFKMASTHWGVGLSDSSRVFVIRKAIDFTISFFKDQNLNLKRKTIKDPALYVAKKYRDYLLSVYSDELDLKASDFKEELNVNYEKGEQCNTQRVSN